MITRHAYKAIANLSKMFSSVMLTGARQVGKTTLLKEYGKNFEYITFDDPMLINEVNENGKNFLKSYSLPLIIDEIQYAPIIFHYVKILCDESKKKGIIFMSGSQQFKMMKNVSESLTGRVGIVNLSSLSLREINNDDFSIPFFNVDDYFSKRSSCIKQNNIDIWYYIQRGTMPELTANPEYISENYYATYVNTYIERDVQDLTQIGDKSLFTKFMISIAARTGQLLNKADISKDIGVSEPTINRWISILETSNIIYLLYPYSNNHLKRVLKTPKIYFLDTGLCAYLTKWSTKDTLEHGAQAGNYFETFIISEIIKSYYNYGIITPPIYYYRDKEGTEIDLIIERDNTLFPFEIKKYTNYSRNDINAFKKLNAINDINIGTGGIICMYDKLVNLDDKNFVIPYNYI